MGRIIGWIVAVAGLVALVLAARYVGQDGAVAAEEEAGFNYVVPVILTQVARGDLQPTAGLSAEVRSSRRAGLSFSGSGRLQSVLVKEADEVQAGMLLAELVAGDEEHELARAQAALNLAELEQKLILAGERDEEKQRLLAELEAARAEEGLALLEVERADSMLDANLISVSVQDRRKATSDVSIKRTAAAQQTYRRALAGARPEDLAIAQARVEEAGARVAFAEHRLRETKLHAPWSGSIVSRMLSAGDFVAPGTGVFEIVDLNNLEIHIEVPGHFAGRLGSQAKARMTLARRAGFELLRPLDAIVPAADPLARSFRAIVRLEGEDNAANILRPGMSVNVELFLEPVKDALLVPTDCILAGEHGRYLVTASKSDAGMQADFVPVIVLAESDGVSAVESLGPPLKAGDKLVLTGADNAFPGAPLLVRGEDGVDPEVPKAGGAGGMQE